MTFVKTRTRRIVHGGRQAGCCIRVDGDAGGGECLALGVAWRDESFRLLWSEYGKLNPGAEQDDFAVRLRRRVGRRAFWVPVTDRGAEQNLAIHAVDLDARDERGKPMARGGKREIFVRTQVGQHVPETSPDDIAFADTRQFAAGRSHTIGAIVRRSAVKQSYDFWRGEMRLRSPHVGSAVIGLANVSVALMPELVVMSSQYRLVVLETLHAIYGCFFQGRRLLHALFYEPAAMQRLHPDMLTYWQNRMRVEFAVEESIPIELRVVQSWPLELAPPGVEAGCIWRPWESSRLSWPDPKARACVLENLDLAPVAFGLALQGV